MQNKLTRLPLLAALICTASSLTFAAEREARETHLEHVDRAPGVSPHEQTQRLESRAQLTPEHRVISKDYLRQRLDWLAVKDPAHFRTHATFDSLIAAGYDPMLLNLWLDGLSDGVVVVGMPGELVTSYFGEPLSINDVMFDGTAAFEWGIPLLPGRVEKVTVAGGKVVSVRG